MAASTKAALLLVMAWQASATLAAIPTANVTVSPSAPLHGRFLHVTDIHPDYYYRFNASVAAACHWNAQPDDPRAGFWGTPNSDCDSPSSLVNATFAWLDKRWADQIDFVIWTGDSARHDIDNRYPRSFIEIMRLNEDLVSRMQAVFGRRVPIVPSIGNNDVWPHNLCDGGPSATINSLQTVWRDMIPESEYHVFARGAYYATEVVPGLIVVSLNTLYFFASNKIVDGCPFTKKGRHDPGTEQLAWLQTRLSQWRKQGKQVWLSGHVPPSSSWYANCAARYGELAIAYQDIILGHLFGHVNVDHFFWSEYASTLRPSRLEAMVAPNALEADLQSEYRGLQPLRKLKLEDYAVYHVSPSVVPTYQPTVRIFTYNTTVSSRYEPRWDGSATETEVDGSVEIEVDEYEDDESEPAWTMLDTWRQRVFGYDPSSLDALRKRKKGRRKGKKKKKRIEWPAPVARHASPLSPSRTSRYLTPLGYTQWMLDLDVANAAGADVTPEWEVEYTTYRLADVESFLKGERARVDQPSPFPWVQGHNDSTIASMIRRPMVELAPYEMPDLTIGRWLDLAFHLGRSKKLWKAFRRRMFVATA